MDEKTAVGVAMCRDEPKAVVSGVLRLLRLLASCSQHDHELSRKQNHPQNPKNPPASAFASLVGSTSPFSPLPTTDSANYSDSIQIFSLPTFGTLFFLRSEFPHPMPNKKQLLQGYPTDGGDSSYVQDPSDPPLIVSARWLEHGWKRKTSASGASMRELFHDHFQGS